MAIRSVNISGGNGFPVKFEIDTDADHSGLPNSAFFKQADKDFVVRYKDALGNIVDAFLSPGSGAGPTVVANYSALPSAAAAIGLFYWASSSQGTKWLPGSIGGTYYPNGLYYSNGTSWEYFESPYQATQSEVNTGTDTDKFVTPFTLSNSTQWSNYLDKATYDINNDGVVDSSEREQIQIINKTGATLTKGTIVYIKTSSSSASYPEVLKANASTEATSSKTIGAIYEDILDSAVGYIITSGQVHNLNTSAYNIGDKLWLATTDGLVTTTPPSEPNHTVFIGHVTRSQTTNGRILYAIQNGYELNELHGVSVPSPSNNNVLYFDNATGLWKDKALSTSDISDIQITSPIVNQLLQWNGSKWINASSSVVNAGPGVIYFLTNYTAGFGTYDYMSKTPDNLAEIEESVVVNANTVLIHEYISDAPINKTLIDAGIWEFNFFGYVNTLNASFVIDTYKRTSGGTETLLFSAETELINWLTPDLSNSITVQQAFACNATDSLVIKVYGKTTQTSNVTLKLVHSGSTHYSHFHTPLTTAHNDIAGLQGGASGEYFHLNSSDNTKVTGWTTSGIPDSDIQSATTWNAKQNALTIGNITDVGTDGISITGGTGAIIGSGVSISQQVANATQNGYLSSTDWISFSNFIPKLNANETYRGININNNSTTVLSEGGVVMSSSASTLAQTVASTNFATKQIRLRYYASTVSGGRYTGTRGSALLWYIHGGFRYVCDFNISDTAFSANCQQFYGLAGQTTDLAYGTATGILVSTLTNIIGIGSEVGDTNLQVFHNDATGTATKVDLGVNFPANRTAGAISTTVYSIQLYNEPMSTDVRYEVKNNETGDIATGTISTNLPLSTQGLNFFASRCMSTTSVTSTGQFDLMKLGVYSQL
jgi:hypothetical protein